MSDITPEEPRQSSQDLNMTDTAKPTPNSSLPSRRSIARGAAWSLPVIAVGSAVPAFAASVNACKPVSYYVGFRITENDDLEQPGEVDVTVGPVNDGTGYQFFTLASDTSGFTATISSLYLDITYPYQVTWNTVPAGYSVALQSSSGGNYIYRFTATYLATTITVATPATNLGRANPTRLNSVPAKTFKGTANAISLGGRLVPYSFQVVNTVNRNTPACPDTQKTTTGSGTIKSVTGG